MCVAILCFNSHFSKLNCHIPVHMYTMYILYIIHIYIYMYMIRRVILEQIEWTLQTILTHMGTSVKIPYSILWTSHILSDFLYFRMITEYNHVYIYNIQTNIQAYVSIYHYTHISHIYVLVLSQPLSSRSHNTWSRWKSQISSWPFMTSRRWWPWPSCWKDG